MGSTSSSYPSDHSGLCDQYALDAVQGARGTRKQKLTEQRKRSSAQYSAVQYVNITCQRGRDGSWSTKYRA